MNDADKLRKKFEKDLENLQKVCKHKKTKWCEEWWALAHGTGWEVLCCENCQKTLSRKTTCSVCRKEVLIDECKYQKEKVFSPIRQGYCSEECYNLANSLP